MTKIKKLTVSLLIQPSYILINNTPLIVLIVNRAENAFQQKSNKVKDHETITA
jgi:hypothetical protein